MGEHYPYTAAINWPRPQPQIDWVDRVAGVEQWLGQHVGEKNRDWAWVGPEFSPSWLCCVMFKKSQDLTLFLLAWGS